ncbi:unnamed protein product, partial [Heterosigma akashiwo]
MREQKRSVKISKQIDRLRALLQEAGAQVKPNKHAVLSGVVHYMAQLHKQAQALDLERRQWLAEAHAGAPEAEAKARPGPAGAPCDYRRVFQHMGLPAAVAAVDGRFVDCNAKFEEATGYSRRDVVRLTLFNLAAPHDLQRAVQRGGPDEMWPPRAGGGGCDAGARAAEAKPWRGQASRCGRLGGPANAPVLPLRHAAGAGAPLGGRRQGP